jgi:hypothetical protein
MTPNASDPSASTRTYRKSSDKRAGITQADFFVRQLESRILSRLSQDITDKIFGPDADASGEFRFQGTTIAFETLLDGTVFIRIIDTANGGETTIEVPAFLTAAQ